jgi:thioredoxin 1
VGKANIDECPKMAARFGVQEIPALVILEGGEVRATHFGLTTKQQLDALLREHLGDEVMPQKR